MDRLQLHNLLERVRAGSVSFDDALRELKDLPFADLGYAMVDHHRARGSRTSAYASGG